MKRISIIVLALVFAALARADSSMVKGQLTFNSLHFGQIGECGTGRTIEFGTMASAPYFSLVTRYETLSEKGKKAVLVSVTGRLSATSTGKLVLNTPQVVDLQLGTCDAG
jgi:hypothetical protein